MRKLALPGLLLAVVLLATLLLAASLKPARPLEFHNQVLLDLPLDESWDLMRDLSLAHHYVPGIRRTEITTAQKEGVGTSRRVYSSATDYINETVTDWRPGSGFDLALQDDDGAAPAPFKEAIFSYALQAHSPQETLLTMRLKCTMRGGVAGHWLASNLLAGIFQERLDSISRSVKQFYESNADTGTKQSNPHAR